MKTIALILFSFLWAGVVLAQSSASDSVVVSDASDATLNQDNPCVCINHKDRNLIVVAAASDFDDMDANGMSAYTTTDMGLSWSLSRLPLPINPDLYVYGESSITCDNAGTFYYAYITNDGVDSGGNISIATSLDGKTWKNAAPINNNVTNYGHPDGVSITVDNSPTSLHKGRVYVVWNQYYSDSTLSIQEGVTIAWSDNGCKTWNTPVTLGPSDDYQQVRTGKNGEIYVSCSDSAGIGQLLFTSTDGGATFDNLGELIGIFQSYPFYTVDATSGYTRLKGINGFAAFPYVSFDVDLTTNRIHSVYGDYQDGFALQYYVFSDDNGKTWSDPEIVGVSATDSTSADRFDPSVSVDQSTHEAYALYYSSELDKNNLLTAPYRIRLRDSFIEMLAPAFNPLFVEKTDSTDSYIGDHTSSDAFDTVYAASWTQNREGLSDGDVFVYVSRPKAGKSAVSEPTVLHSSSIWLSAPYPNPTSGKEVLLNYYLPSSVAVSFEISDAQGKVLIAKELDQQSAGSYTVSLSLPELATGAYLVRMVTPESQLSRKIIVTAR